MCCETPSCYARRVVIMILKDTATFQVLFIVSLFSAWSTITVEINSGVYLLRNIMKVCEENTVELHLLIVIEQVQHDSSSADLVLVLLFWSCQQRSWS